MQAAAVSENLAPYRGQVSSPAGRAIAGMLRSGAGAIASGLLAAAGTKILAVMLGAPAVALLQTLQQIRQAALVAATANGQTALVQGASVRTGRARLEYLRTILGIFLAATATIAALLVMLRERVAAAAGLPQGSGSLVAVLAVAVVFSSGLVFLSALLNAAGQIGRLATLPVLGAAGMAAGAWPAAMAMRAGHPSALPALLAVAAVIGLGAAAKFTFVGQAGRLLTGPLLTGLGRWWTWRDAQSFFSISGVMLGTGLMASLGLLAVRARISRSAGLDATGHWDAAWAISMNHVTLVLASLQAGYLPELARARPGKARLRQISTVFAVAILTATPVIVTLVVLRPVVVGALYSGAFQNASAYLRWTLLGDYFKVTAWVLAMPMLASADMGILLATDTLVQAVFLGGSWLLATIRPPAEAAAMGFALSYAVCLAVSWWYASRRHGFRFTPRRAALWMGGLALVVGATAATWSDRSVCWPKAAVWMALAAAASAGVGGKLLRGTSLGGEGRRE